MGQLSDELSLRWRKIFLLVLVVCIDHEEPVGFGNMKVDKAHSSAFSFATPRTAYPHLPQPAASGHYFAKFWEFHQELLKCGILLIPVRRMGRYPFGESRCLDEPLLH